MYKAIPEVFFETAEKHPNKPAFLYKKQGVYFPIAYKEVSKKVEIFSSCLSALGVNKGDRVAILSENRSEWAISDLSIMAVGAVVVPLHATFTPKAVCNVLNHSRAKILIVSNSELLNKVLLGQKYLKHLEKIIIMESLSATQKENLTGKVISWKAIFSQNQNNKFEKIFLDPDDCCSIIYTSGTTGKPKGVILSHRNFLSNVEAINEIVPVKENDVFLSFLPLSHVLERTIGYYVPICYGATIAYAENTKQLPANLKEVKPTVIISVPRVFEKFHDAIWDKINSSPDFQKRIFKWALKQKKNTLRYKIADFAVFKKVRRQLGGKLRLAISGGASLNENIAGFFSKIGIMILEGYGLTETSPVISTNREFDFKFGTVGKIIPGVKVKIADDKEILVKGPNVFQEYFRGKNEAKICFDKEGWFCTGDLGFIDKQGFLTIIGRAKEMIVTSGGKNVWPEPVENLLNNDRFISQAIIIGNSRKFISALIVPDWQEIEMYFKQNNLSLQEHDKLIKSRVLLDIFQKRIDEKINPNLHDFEKIRNFRLLPQEFSQEREELTATLKFRRHIIETHYKKSIESMYN
ncbi:MAG: long-chain fatty acid--CoA ligase [Candidatus Staskawiczbacteria bacterium]|nr:long-chain fatty acid--CoA ligase [Candidatus Staskawiczbacteria bacterium]